MIIASIDVTLLDKARFKEVTCKDGHVAKYCELVLIETPNGQYGDYMVKQGVTKEEREARIEMPILGNGKVPGQKPQGQQQQRQQQAPQRRERPAPPHRQERQAPQSRRPPADPDLDGPDQEF